MKKLPLIGLLFSFTSFGHFLLLKPSTDIVEFPQREVQIEVKFSHPMEGGPNMAFTIADSGAVINGKKTALH
jgi:cobalt/nickel transport protein